MITLEEIIDIRDQMLEESPYAEPFMIVPKAMEQHIRALDGFEPIEDEPGVFGVVHFVKCRKGEGWDDRGTAGTSL